MKTIFKTIMWLRPLWANKYVGLIGVWFFIFYFVKYWTLPIKKRKDIRDKWDVYKGIKSVNELVLFFNHNYKYAPDLAGGAFDHDNSPYELYLRMGDCDDMAAVAKKCLKKIKGISDVQRIALFDTSNPKSAHFDCHYIEGSDHFLFNYGNIKRSDTFDGVIKEMCDAWYAKETYDKVIYTKV